ncbi:MAG: cell division protein FtsL [Lachnospiraceae bacterium]|nr:cell division protein FtsL [Lachnospiraceae bacterium]
MTTGNRTVRPVRRVKKQETRTSRYGRNGAYGEYYVDGNTAKVIDVRRAIEEDPNPQLSRAAKINRAHAKSMNPAFMFFFALALVVSFLILVSYLRLQAENHAIMEQISSLESTLYAKQTANNEEYDRIVSSVDLNHVKEVAMNELGMRYASEGQIVEVEAKGDDYVRQYQEMP